MSNQTPLEQPEHRAGEQMTTLSLEDLERDLAASAARKPGMASDARPDISDLAALWRGGERERALELADAWRRASGLSSKIKT